MSAALEQIMLTLEQHKHSHPERLFLQGNDVMGAGAVDNTIRPALIREDGVVTRLELHGFDVSAAQHLPDLMDMLKHEHNKVETLSLSSISFDRKAGKALADALVHVNCKVTELENTRGGLSSTLTLLATALKQPTARLRSLKLSYNEMTEKDLKAIVPVLKVANGALRTFHLSDWTLSEAVDAVIRALGHATCKLEDIKLSAHMGDDSAEKLAKILQNKAHNQVRCLDLSENRISNSGMFLLGRSFVGKDFTGSYNQVEELNLSENKFTEFHSGVLQYPCCKLKKVDLCGDHIGSASAVALSKSIQDDKCMIESLRIIGCGVAGPGLVALATALQHENNKLRQLDVRQEGRYNQAYKVLAQAVRSKNCKLEQMEGDDDGILDEALGDAKTFRGLLALVSASTVQRLGARSAMSRLSVDYIRLVADMTPIAARDYEDDEDGEEEEEEDDEEEMSEGEMVARMMREYGGDDFRYEYVDDDDDAE